MSKTVIICEKPSVMRTVANALGAKKGNGDSITNSDGSLYVTSVGGHFLELYKADEYKYGENTKQKDLWKDVPLPIIPDEFLYKVKDDSWVKSRLKSILALCKECDTIVNCGDADREGQIIIDEILIKYGFLGNKNKKIKRMWLPTQTDEDIQKAYKNLSDNDDYSNIRNEGFARANIDWLYGINLTRLMSLKAGITFRTGRLIVPIVKYIYDREMAIKNFVSKPYFVVKNNENIALTTKEKWETKAEAEKQMEELNKVGKAKVVDIKEKDVKQNPKKLFSLNKLQEKMGEFGFNPDETLKIAQRLYEKQYTTYPRVNTEYAGEEEKEKFKEIIEKHNPILKKEIAFKDTKTIFDSSKVESHSAITPTKEILTDEKQKKFLENLLEGAKRKNPKITEQQLNKLKEEEQKKIDEEKIVYTVICNRFYSNFCKEETIISKKEMSIVVGDYNFKINGQAIKQEGFFYFEKQGNDVMLPNYQIGDEFDVKFGVEEKKTTPPPQVTSKEILKWFEKPFKKIDLVSINEESEENVDEVAEDIAENDDEDYKMILQGVEIGTPATRGETIKKCQENGYIVETKKGKSIKYSITALGITFIETLDKLGINLYAEKTVELSKILKNVQKNNATIKEAEKMATDELEEIIENTKVVKVEKVENTANNGNNGREEVGKYNGIPVFKGIKDGKTYYSSFDEEKPFYMEEMIWFKQVKLKLADAKKLLKGESIKAKLKSKAGNEFDAFLKIKGVNEKGFAEFGMEYANNKN